MSSKKSGVTASELMTRLHADPAHLARVAERDTIRRARLVSNSEAAAPILSDLVAAGFQAESLSALRRVSDGYVGAIPILVGWLPQIRNIDVKMDVVRCLSVPYARPMAIRPLLDAFRDAEDEHSSLRWAIGNALEIVADETVIDDMMELAGDRRYGKAREMIVAGLGNMRDERVLQLLLDLLKDDGMSGHAIMALGKLKAPAARPHVEPFLRHARPWVRKEAKKTIEKIDKAGGRVY